MIVTFKRSSMIIRLINRYPKLRTRTLQLKRLQWGPVESNMSVQQNVSQQNLYKKKQVLKIWLHF